jgi:hypothetical protein
MATLEQNPDEGLQIVFLSIAHGGMSKATGRCGLSGHERRSGTVGT